MTRMSLILVTASVLSGSWARADLKPETGITESVTNNLLKDSTRIKDSYSRSVAALKFYPAPFVEAAASAQYTYYSKTFELSDLLSSAGLTLIRTKETSPFTVYLSGNYQQVWYRQRFESFDNRTIRLNGSVAYEVAPNVRLRAGSEIILARYLNDDSADADNDQYHFHTGVNLVVFGSNSFDVEVGLGGTNFSFISDTLPFVNPRRLQSHLEDGSFSSFFVSPRFSRPIGSKTGLSLTYTYRRFSGAADAVVLGYSTGFLSPWAAVYDGSWVVLELKSYVVPQTILAAGIGYWDKTYLKALELRVNPLFGGIEYPPPTEAQRRHDKFTSLYVSVQRPVVFGLHGRLEPTITLEYSDNSSNLDQYDYDETTISIGLMYR